MAEYAPRISRRTLLIGGGAGAGLLLAWSLWPRRYAPNLRTGPGEHLFNAFLKIASDGRVIVAVPQVELGQGVWTTLPQILADELGAAWETIAVEPAPPGPFCANQLIAEERAVGPESGFLDGVRRWRAREVAARDAAMVTGGSTSVRAFEQVMREAGAGARALLMKAAAARWNVPWESLDTAGGFVVGDAGKLRFGELAEAAAAEELPDVLLMRGGVDNRLAGQALTRLDLPSKVDGSARFAGDVRLADMLFASVRSAPPGGSLLRVDRDAAKRVPGVARLFDSPQWVAALATDWWAADRALRAMNPAWRVAAEPSVAGIEAAFSQALEEDDGERLFERGDLAAAFAGGDVVRGHYFVGPAANAPLETLTATVRLSGDLLEIWAPVQAPGIARDAAARVAGLPEANVTVYPMLVGGGYGRKFEVRAIEQAVVLAMKARRPVQVVWSRAEETAADTLRPPARGMLTARLGSGGLVAGWRTRIAAPDVRPQLERRLGSDILDGLADPVAGAAPPYGIPAVAVDYSAAEVPIERGLWRSGAHAYTTFFSESFVDELSRLAGLDPLSFRMQMLGDNPRLARCLQTAATMGQWDGGQPGSAMGLALLAAFGSYIATVMEVEIGSDQRVRVRRAVSAVDCGRVVNPNVVRQQIEGGLIFGIAAASANPIDFAHGRPTPRGFGDLAFPGLARSPEVTVELIDSDEAPGGVTELAVPTAAPAMANALFALTGRRLRKLPLVIGG
ncbi:xanthine dehydrogenase family protein molybdopterin-binding subunit [Sphingomonas parva]|uniref:Xanthine dehydrogenase family protein molybdopterin-binding subunit n=1 Tax=Sphingomonas parva TaxID=2555898 RepID=A0A4Y8ZWI8_9SPHN|nr:molybdopterin cofactor-binding domain-containing protein [Sphingomonas parva]TFI59837.1 xanthine dehydrogenase family protein molybdopterin-binding subunit [Sphingomonas parva]